MYLSGSDGNRDKGIDYIYLPELNILAGNQGNAQKSISDSHGCEATPHIQSLHILVSSSLVYSERGLNTLWRDSRHHFLVFAKNMGPITYAS